MISATLKVTTEGVVGALEKEAWDRIARAVVFFWQALQTVLNVPNPPPYVNSSLPGEPPRKRTGWLAGHVIYELDRKALAGRVGLGKNAKYGIYLEIGTSRGLLARPWFYATLKKILPQLEAIMK